MTGSSEAAIVSKNLVDIATSMASKYKAPPITDTRGYRLESVFSGCQMEAAVTQPFNFQCDLALQFGIAGSMTAPCRAEGCYDLIRTEACSNGHRHVVGTILLQEARSSPG
jgi:hypothetical protein